MRKILIELLTGSFVFLFAFLFVPQVSARIRSGYAYDYGNHKRYQYDYPRSGYSSYGDYCNYNFHGSESSDNQKIENAREYFNNNADYYKNTDSVPAIYLHGHIVHL